MHQRVQLGLVHQGVHRPQHAQEACGPRRDRVPLLHPLPGGHGAARPRQGRGPLGLRTVSAARFIGCASAESRVPRHESGDDAGSPQNKKNGRVVQKHKITMHNAKRGGRAPGGVGPIYFTSSQTFASGTVSPGDCARQLNASGAQDLRDRVWNSITHQGSIFASTTTKVVKRRSGAQ